MRRLSTALTVLFVFTIPWQNLVGSFTDYLLIAAFGCTATSCLLAGKLKRPTVFGALVAGFVVWQIATALWSVDQSATLSRVRGMLLVLVMIWTLVELASNPRGVRLFMQSYVAGCFILCGVLVASYLNGHTLTSGASGPTYLNANDSADLLALGIAMSLYLLSGKRDRSELWMSIVYLPIGLIGVVLTASRSGFIFTCLAFLALYFVLKTTRPVARVAWIVLIVGAFTGVFIAVASSSTLNANLERITFRSDQSSVSTLTGRTTIWAAGLAEFGKRPLAGSGAGTFELVTSNALPAARAAHNLYLELAVEDGGAGLILVVSAIVAALVNILRWRDTRTGPSIAMFLVLLGTSMVANISTRYSFWLGLTLLSVAALHHGVARSGVEADGLILLQGQEKVCSA